MKIYLLSGADKVKGYTSKLKEDLKKSLKEIKMVVGVSGTPTSYERNDNVFFGGEGRLGVLNMLKGCGIKIKKAALLDKRTSMEDGAEMLKQADVIFLLGGDPEAQIKYIKEFGYDKIIKNHKGTILGVSAGSMNCANDVAYLSEDERKTLISYKGLGLTNIFIYPHVSKENKDLMTEAEQVSNKRVVFALPNESYVKIEDDKITINGDCYLFANGTCTEINNHCEQIDIQEPQNI